MDTFAHLATIYKHICLKNIYLYKFLVPLLQQSLVRGVKTTDVF